MTRQSMHLPTWIYVVNLPAAGVALGLFVAIHEYMLAGMVFLVAAGMTYLLPAKLAR